VDVVLWAALLGIMAERIVLERSLQCGGLLWLWGEMGYGVICELIQ
jgi:hypothetical protein